MSEIQLAAKSPLGGVRLEFEGITVSEVTDRAIVSVATPLGGEAALTEALLQAYGADIPKVGGSTMSAKHDARFLGLQSDQMFVLFPHAGLRAVDDIAGPVRGAAALTDQSDSWVLLRVEGAKSRLALERICPVDLAASAFPPGAVARTIMEHLGAIIVCEDTDKFLLMSARSSARSFLHAVETSARNVS